MLHEAALQLLLPLELGGVNADDLTVEGLTLDRIATDIEALRQTIISESVPSLLPVDGQICMAAARGDIKKPYFIALAAWMGYVITIEDITAENSWQYFSAGVSNAGDYLAQEDSINQFLWKLVIHSLPDIIPSPDLETVLMDLKPAEIQLYVQPFDVNASPVGGSY